MPAVCSVLHRHRCGALRDRPGEVGPVLATSCSDGWSPRVYMEVGVTNKVLLPQRSGFKLTSPCKGVRIRTPGKHVGTYLPILVTWATGIRKETGKLAYQLISSYLGLSHAGEAGIKLILGWSSPTYLISSNERTN